jgi:hypothetical protein
LEPKTINSPSSEPPQKKKNTRHLEAKAILGAKNNQLTILGAKNNQLAILGAPLKKKKKNNSPSSKTKINQLAILEA